LLPREGEEIDDDGNVNIDSIAEVGRKHSGKGCYFYNFYQLQQFVERFAAQWGFAVTTQGNSIVCACAKNNTRAFTSNVSTSKQRYRQTSLKVLKCSLAHYIFMCKRVKKDNYSKQ
jgi:ATP sulfurylase